MISSANRLKKCPIPILIKMLNIVSDSRSTPWCRRPRMISPWRRMTVLRGARVCTGAVVPLLQEERCFLYVSPQGLDFVTQLFKFWLGLVSSRSRRVNGRVRQNNSSHRKYDVTSVEEQRLKTNLPECTRREGSLISLSGPEEIIRDGFFSFYIFFCRCSVWVRGLRIQLITGSVVSPLGHFVLCKTLKTDYQIDWITPQSCVAPLTSSPTCVFTHILASSWIRPHNLSKEKNKNIFASERVNFELEF